MEPQPKHDRSPEAIRAEFTHRRSAVVRYMILLGGAVIAVALWKFTGEGPKTTGVLLLAVLFLCSFVINWQLWRCPSCSGHLGRLRIGHNQPKFCPKCGVELIAD